jgi:hypothetical protein
MSSPGISNGVTKKCVCVSQCEQRPNEHLEDANDLMDEELHGRKCQNNGHLVIMRL